MELLEQQSQLNEHNKIQLQIRCENWLLNAFQTMVCFKLKQNQSILFSLSHIPKNIRMLPGCQVIQTEKYLKKKKETGKKKREKKKKEVKK